MNTILMFSLVQKWPHYYSTYHHTKSLYLENLFTGSVFIA